MPWRSVSDTILDTCGNANCITNEVGVSCANPVGNTTITCDFTDIPGSGSVGFQVTLDIVAAGDPVVGTATATIPITVTDDYVDSDNDSVVTTTP